MPNQSNGSDDGGVMAPMTGDYNKLNQSQSTVWKYAQPMFQRVMTRYNDVPASSSKNCFRVADYGCATGGNSLSPLSFVAKHLPANYNTLEVFMVDLPNTAWNSVAETVTPKTIIADANNEEKNVFVNMVGRSFYDQCVPEETLDFNYSFVALHWMKSYPCDIPSGLYATDPIHNTDPVSLQTWRNAGQDDLLEFTNARYVELKPNGYFVGVIACPKRTSNGDYPWSKVGRIVYDSLTAELKSSLISKDGDDNEGNIEKIMKEFLAPCVLPCCWRTEDNVRDGFPSHQWIIDACEFHETKDPVRESLERGTITPIKYGQSVIDSFKAVCHPTCLNSLSSNINNNNNTIDEAETLLHSAYKRSIPIIANDPQQYNLDVSFWYVLARKK